MGEIYEACDATLGRDVAVKVLAEHYAHDAALRARFTREALAAARLSSEPHTVTIFDVGEWNGGPYIVMELRAGGTVADRRDARGVAAGESLRWLEQAGAALDAAHARGVVHRDVKPANLLLTAEGEVRVADFGIASAAGLASLTETGSVLGTFGYLAPEQAAGATAGPAADRYALAVVAYELLAGRRPFEHDTGAARGARGRRASRCRRSPSCGPACRRALDAGVRARARDGARGALRRRAPSSSRELRRAFAEDAEPTARADAAPRAGTRARRRAPVPWLPVAIALVAARRRRRRWRRCCSTRGGDGARGSAASRRRQDDHRAGDAPSP